MLVVNESAHELDKTTDDVLLLPIPPIKRRGFSRVIGRWLNMEVANAGEPRTIALGCSPAEWNGHGFPDNAVNNRRFSLVTFLPLSLFHQFSSFFNMFYLLLTISQLVPQLKVGFSFTYFAPLAMVVALSLIKDAVDDIQRYRRDRMINKECVEKLIPGGEKVLIRASSIEVGDILVLHHGQRIPADCVLLRTLDKNGTCFIRTDQLDGETDWKLRHALKKTQLLPDDGELSRLRANIRCEPLHKDIYAFAGAFYLPSGEPEAISLENTLWSSCVLASSSVMAAVLHTGVDTRCSMNSSKPSTKSSLIQCELNIFGALCLLFLLTVSFLLVSVQEFEGQWGTMFVRFLILLSAIIPISMRVNVDVGRMWYSYEMHRDPKIPGTIVRNTDIPEELGRLQYLFADKTGTLTKNKMEFRVLQVHADILINHYETERFRRLLSNFFFEPYRGSNVISTGNTSNGNSGTTALTASQKSWMRETVSVGEAMIALVVCHNVSPVMEDGQLEYQASSPDEVSFVKFCSSLGLCLSYRDTTCLKFTTPGGKEFTYDIIKNFPFTSERKCMGILLREHSGGDSTFKYFMKGADFKIASAVRSSEWLQESSQEFARVGLRTLVFAQRTLTEEQVEMFLSRYNEANADLGETRNESLDAAMRFIERDMKLIGVTGVDDELQDDVTTTLETFGMGGVKVWVLTGDKIETATTIGRSTRLIPRHGAIEILRASTEDEAYRQLNALMSRYDAMASGPSFHGTPWTLILDGDTLSFCLERTLARSFTEVARGAYSVIIARCSPTQKAAVIRTIKRYSSRSVRMAAIGDGGNDVAMILAADVGIGVEGIEGKQASMAADFSITKFSHCLRLIMWHGRNSYRRTCRMSQFILHRGMVYSVVQAFFSLLFAGTTMSLFNGYLLMGYSTLFTMAPVFALVLDEDVGEEDVNEFPQLYQELMKSRSMNTLSFLKWAWISVFQGGMMMFLSLQLFSDAMFQIMAIVYTSLLLTELVIVAGTAHLGILWRQHRSHLYLFIAAECFSIAAFFLAVVVLPETIDQTFFFSWSCWWRVAVISLTSILPIFILWVLSKSSLWIPQNLQLISKILAMWPFRTVRITSRYSSERMCCAFSSLLVFKRFLHAQEISPNEISFMEPAAESGGRFADYTPGATGYTGGCDFPEYFIDAKNIDTFSRARVVNFIKRHSQGSVANGNEIFQANEIRRDDGPSLYHCRVRLPFEGHSGELWAHGVACNAKDAEMLAAMHAEHIIDEFGHHIYTLPSMQRKHAEAARKAGRWAPLPDEVDRAKTDTSLPPPLRRIVDRDETESGKWLLLDMRASHYIAPHHTLLSPCLPDPTAVHRIKSLFAEHNLSFTQLCTSCAEEPLEKGAPAYFVAVVILPPELTTFGELRAQGKALVREAAVTLACMHAELVLDAHGISLFPADAAAQKMHALAAWSYGRPAPLPGEPHKDPLHVVCPLPLKELAVRRELRVSGMSYEEDLVRRHRALTEQTCEFIDVDMLDHGAVDLLKGFLRDAQVPREDPFFTEELSGYYKTSVVLPLPDLFGVRGGVGIGVNAAEASVLASMHAIDVLNALGLHIIADSSAQARWVEERRARGESVPVDVGDPATPSPPGRRRRTAQRDSADSPRVGEGPKRRVAKRARGAADEAHVSEQSSAGTEEKEKEKDIPYLQARETVPKELWELNPDSPDGFIMVSPHDPEIRTQYEHALYSPRQIDVGAKVRVRNYLASMGRRAEEAFFVQRVDAEDNGGMAICRCAVNLPVPRRFGDRIALGEAVDPRDAECLAAMHAELILDAIGVPLYADGANQKRHADLCARSGRYAPSGAGDENASKISPDAPSPPPLRREVVGSIHWENREKLKRKPIVLTKSRGDAPTTAAATETAAAAAAAGSPESLDVDDGAPSIPKERRDYTFVPESELDLVSRARVQYYLRRNGIPRREAEFRMEIRGLGNVLHIAEITIPVPASLGGTRVAHGSALTKRDADILCWMHAERTIDALGLCIFDNLPKLQTKHVQRVQKQGRWAPLPDEAAAKPLETPSPLPLTLGTAPDKPPYPTPPVDVRRDWEAYTESCKKFIEVNTMREHNVFYEMGKNVRTGDAIYDAALEESETAVLEVGVKHTLQRYCNEANVTYPTYWKSRVVGSIACRVCLTTVEVPGHEHILASGVGATKDISQRRAAMHVFALLRRIEPDFDEIERKIKEEPVNLSDSLIMLEDMSPDTTIRMQLRPSASKAQQQRRVGNWDPVARDFSHEGKVRIIELFTVCFGLPPPVVRHLTRKEGHLVTHATTVEVTDEDGKTWIGRANNAGRRLNEPAAYEDIFSKLSRGIESFKGLMDLIRTHQHLDPEHIANISLTDEQKERMHRAISSLPDVEEETTQTQGRWDAEKENEAAGMLARVAMDASQRAQESQELLRKLQEKMASEEYQSRYAAQRQRLSIFAKREEIVDAIERNQIVIICGTTGCGKTTQVPQFILDHLTDKGEGGNCSIVITQPRRLSAVSIARRVAAERLEVIGETCGYSIRLDTRPGRNINFCTSGILLRLLHSSPHLNGINYLIIDEIHERDINSDFLLILLKQLLRQRSDLHVILMSATLQAEQFGNYFDGAPIINVEGYVHPVQELYLEDLVPIAAEQQVMPPLLKEAAAALEKSEGEANGNLIGWDVLSSPTVTSKYGFLEVTADIDYVTLQFAINHAVRSLDLRDSSVLVFLPGWDEITRAKEILERDNKYYIICLHSSVGAEEQMRCFLPAPEGKVKLILSTNIAESGVTIDDVAAVIDLGRAKEKSYVLRKGTTNIGRNEIGSMSQLVTVYASRANCVQRRGRAGRTRPGMCIRLFSKRHFQTVHDFQTPEMLRTPLDALCLMILALNLGDPAEFLQQAIEAPSPDHIEGAMMRLNELGATTSRRHLTPLGMRLSRLPVAPKVGKMVIMGAILRCLDSVLTIAAVTDTDVFITSRDYRDAVRMHREDLSRNTQSDVIASLNGFNFWVVAHHEKTPAEVVYDLQERMLSVPQLLTVSRYKRQFFEIIESSGFLGNRSDLRHKPLLGNENASRADIFVDKSEYSVDALNVGLVKCVVASGLFPNVVMNRGKRLMRNKLENRLSPSTGSVVHLTSQEDIIQPFFVYDELTKSSETGRLMVRGLTNVSLWTILLMGTSSMPVTYRDDLSLAVVDEWIMFRATFGTLELIRKFKRALNVCLGRKFLDPSDQENNAKMDELRDIIKELVSTPFKPNELSEKLWEEKGVIVEPRTQATTLPSGGENTVTGMVSVEQNNHVAQAETSSQSE